MENPNKIDSIKLGISSYGKDKYKIEVLFQGYNEDPLFGKYESKIENEFIIERGLFEKFAFDFETKAVSYLNNDYFDLRIIPDRLHELFEGIDKENTGDVINLFIYPKSKQVVTHSQTYGSVKVSADEQNNVVHIDEKKGVLSDKSTVYFLEFQLKKEALVRSDVNPN